MHMNLLRSLPLRSPDAGTETGGGSTGTVVADPTVPAGDKITLSKGEYEAFVASKSEADRLRASNAELDSRWKDAQTLLRSDLPPEQAEAAMRRVMTAAGRTNEEIEAQIRMLRSDDDESETPRRGREGDDETSALLKRQQQELDSLKSNAQRDRERLLRGNLDRSVVTAVDTNKDLAKLVSKLVEVQDEDGTKSADVSEAIKATIRGEVTDALKKRLTQRRAEAQGQWDDSWIEAEAPNAAAQVLKKYRTMIGDPSKLGRSGHADTGFDSLINNTKPVPAPAWKPGMNEANAGTAVRNWAVDSLLRGASEASSNMV